MSSDTGMLLRYFLEEVEFVLHWGHDKIVFSLFVVLWLFFSGIPWSLGCLWPFVDLLTLMLDPSAFLSFGHLAPLKVSRDDHWFSSETVLTSDDRQFKIIGLVHFWVFRTLSDRRSRQPLLVSTLIKDVEEKFLKESYLYTLDRVFLL